MVQKGASLQNSARLDANFTMMYQQDVVRAT
jgi:hypothetical protein